ncbi:Cytochrome P450 4d1 [Lucilia cuprina]|uniref:Cytochrome P450 4d1 n=1 Tax=Lucilia cuprina TaxID=7375 RepID=A0A0L0C055_LUCCU|nr:Cytochrome P450 4d1 [Lucilia cuprina]
MYLNFLIVIVLYILLTQLLPFFKRLSRTRQLSKQFVIPKTIPILGNAHMLVGVKPEHIIYVIRDIIEDCGKTVGFWFGPFIFGVFMMDIKYAECVLSSNTLLVKSMEYDFLRNWLCEGLLISRPPKWFKRRRILTGAFHFNILEQYIEIFDRNTRVFLKNLQRSAEVKGDIVNMDHWLNLVTLDIICGNLNLFWGAQPHDVFKVVTEVMCNYGKTVTFWVFLQLSIFMLDTQDVEYVLGTNNLLVKSQEYDFLKNWLCEGLLISKPTKWFKRRRILTPAFHFKILEQFIEVFDRNAKIFVKNIHRISQKDNGLISMDHWVHLVTLDVICAYLLTSIAIFLFSAAIYGLILYLTKFKRIIEITSNIPSAPTWPIIGHAYHFIGVPAHMMLQRIWSLGEENLRDTKCMKIWLGPELNLLTSDLKDIEIVLGGIIHNEKASEYQVLEPWLKEGLLISRGRKWHQRRKLITGAFHFQILRQFIDNFENETRVMITELERKIHKIGSTSAINLYEFISLCTLDVICGHAHHFIGQPPHRNIAIFTEFVEKYGNTMKIWLGPELNMFFSDIKDVEIVLASMRFNDKADEYLSLEPWLREGLLVSRGQKWHKRRKAITPAFHFKSLNDFIEIFERESRVFIANMDREWRRQSVNGVDLYEWVNLCTLDTICESAMGVSVHAQTNADSEYVRAVKTISTVLHKRMFDILYRFNLTYQFTKLAREEKKALAILHGFTEKIIVQRREELLKAQDNVTETHEDDIGTKRKMAFLDILLQSEIDGKPLSNLDIREEVDTFMFEGHDTTSSAITFCFYNLAMNPKCQQKCFEEIIQVFGTDKSKPVTYEDLNNLHYVELCIKETLRMFPSVPLLGRKVTEECEINGKIVPAGTNIGISPLHLGRQEELFPEPDTFKPERFDIDYTTDKMSPYAYIPFSAGPRNCIGQKFAMLEVKTVLTNVLRHYELDYAGNKDEELLLIAELILRPKDPLMFKIKPRVY